MDENSKTIILFDILELVNFFKSGIKLIDYHIE